MKNIILGAHFLKTSIFKALYFLKWRPIFDDFYSTEHKTFKGLVVGFAPKSRPGRMCQTFKTFKNENNKWGHTTLWPGAGGQFLISSRIDFTLLPSRFSGRNIFVSTRIISIFRPRPASILTFPNRAPPIIVWPHF